METSLKGVSIVIGERIGWSREQVKNYIKLINSIGTNIIEIAKNNQQGRVPQNGTIVPFDFTEGWFSTVKTVENGL